MLIQRKHSQDKPRGNSFRPRRTHTHPPPLPLVIRRSSQGQSRHTTIIAPSSPKWQRTQCHPPNNNNNKHLPNKDNLPFPNNRLLPFGHDQSLILQILTMNVSTSARGWPVTPTCIHGVPLGRRTTSNIKCVLRCLRRHLTKLCSKDRRRSPMIMCRINMYNSITRKDRIRRLRIRTNMVRRTPPPLMLVHTEKRPFQTSLPRLCLHLQPWTLTGL